MLLWLAVLVVVPSAIGVNPVQNGDIVQNGDMESMAHWDCSSIHCELTTDHHSGQHGIKVTGRLHTYEGPSQNLQNLRPNGRYQARGWIKLLNDDPHEIGQKVQLTIAVTFTYGSALSYILVGSHPQARASDGWLELVGNFDMPDHAIKGVKIYYQGPVSSVNFVVDSLSVTPLAGSSNIRAEQDANIERFRKSDINVKVQLSGNLTANQVDIEVIQTKKSFPFGTAVTCAKYLNGDERYQHFINEHFNWAVTTNALKWDQMEHTQGSINYKTPIDAINKLRQHGIKVRAHNIVSSKDRFVPSWVKLMRGQILKDAVRHRIQGVINATKDIVEHWDVNNENLHGFYFQNTLHDRDYDLEIFRIAQQAAAGSNVKLFLNDYGVVAQGASTGAYLGQTKRFKNANVGLYGIGVQCHFHDDQAPDPFLIKEHLDTLAEAGIPVWVTELDVGTNDSHKRADWYETALAAFYGHPAVEGIMFWGFWSNLHGRGEAGCLVSGDSFKINAAGYRVLDLLERQWMTNQRFTLSLTGYNFKVRGFHGDYEIKVKIDGKEYPALALNFTLGKSPHTLYLNVHR